MKTYEEQKSFVAKLNVIDDVFFHKMAEDKEVCEEILRILLSKPNLKVIESQVQRYLRNIGAHSVILDVLCQDENGDYINVDPLARLSSESSCPTPRYLPPLGWVCR